MKPKGFMQNTGRGGMGMVNQQQNNRGGMRGGFQQRGRGNG